MAWASGSVAQTRGVFGGADDQGEKRPYALNFDVLAHETGHGIVFSLVVLFGLEKSQKEPDAMEINYSRLTEYKLGQALLLLALMVIYALALRPAGPSQAADPECDLTGCRFVFPVAPRRLVAAVLRVAAEPSSFCTVTRVVDPSSLTLTM